MYIRRTSNHSIPQCAFGEYHIGTTGAVPQCALGKWHIQYSPAMLTSRVEGSDNAAKTYNLTARPSPSDAFSDVPTEEELEVIREQQRKSAHELKHSIRVSAPHTFHVVSRFLTHCRDLPALQSEF